MAEELITGSLQENLLTLIVFDDQSLPLLATTLEVGMFENDFYKAIVRESFEFFKEFKKAPGEHIADIFETHLTKKSSDKESAVYDRILKSLQRNKDNVNRDYVLSQLNKFIRQQSLKNGITLAHQLVKDGKLDEAELKMSEAINSQIKIFDAGIWLTDLKRSMKFLTAPVQPYPLGIPPLDAIGFGPAPGQLLVILAPANRGKSISLHSRIWLPETGYVSMGSLLQQHKSNMTYGVNHQTQLPELTKILKIFPSGMKPTCNIYLRSGRIVKGLADTHPVLTWNGYVPCKDLSIGDFTIGAATLPLSGTAPMPEIDEAYVIGVFLGDGALTNKVSGPTLCISKEKWPIYEKVVEVLNPNKSPRIRAKGPQALDCGFHLDTQHFLDMWNLGKHKSINKQVPEKIFSLGKEAVAACLAGMFDTDGSVYQSSEWTRIEFATSSYLLSEDILTMLNILGIYARRGNKITTLNGKSYQSWIIILNDEESSLLFSNHVGKYLHHPKKIERLTNRRKTQQVLNRGQFFKRLPYHASQLVVNNGIAWNQTLYDSINRKTRLSPADARQFGLKINNQELLNKASGQFVFDEIIKIDWNEPEECWDMETETQTQSFMCEHVFTHNSQFCVHIAKMCAMQRLKVLYISLEMSEEKIAQRFFQSLFSVTKRQSEIIYTRFEQDELSRLNGFRIESLTRPSLQDEGIETALAKKMQHFDGRFKVFIKRFPTNALSIRGLEAYLDSMERFHNYIPDVLILDYADLLAVDAANLRISTGYTYKELRRIAVERNFAVVSPSQSNRLGEDAKVLSLKYLAEDYSKAATADDIIAYCQSSLELRLGLARLFIAKARDEEREQTVLISQAYKMAQFCMDSTMISDRYWTLLDAHNNAGEEEQPPEMARAPIRRRNIR